MHDNLKTAIEVMFIYAGQTMPPDFDGKKEGWYKEFTWTERLQENYTKWLMDFIKNKWQGIATHKPTNKTVRRAIADKFVFQYGWPTRPLNIKDFTELVPDGQLKEIMSDNEYQGFMRWMTGQTCSPHGVYRWDLERYLNCLPNND
jgi:hypothetical protein